MANLPTRASYTRVTRVIRLRGASGPPRTARQCVRRCQLRLGDDAIVVAGEEEEEIERLRRQRYRFASALQAAQGEVDPVRPELVERLLRPALIYRGQRVERAARAGDADDPRPS